MRILLWPTCYFPNIGGLEKMVHSLAVSLQNRGHEIRVVAQAEKTETFHFEGIQVSTFPFISALFQFNLPLLRRILASVSGFLDSFSPNIIHIHGWFECFCFYQTRILEKAPFPVCLTVHGLLEQKTYDTVNCVKVWKRAQAVNTVSNALALPLSHLFLQTIYNGLPLSKNPLKPIPQNRLLLIGRISEEKCFYIAFHALKLLLPNHPDLRLALVGDGPDFEKLKRLKESLDLPIEMHGFVPPHEVETFIDRSTLVLVPSSYESFSLAALEAALRGRPVVASNVLGLKEVVEDQKTGLLVESQNPAAFAAAIDRLLSHPDQIERMGKAAYERALRLFSIETTTNHYLKMYEQASHLYHHPRS